MKKISMLFTALFISAIAVFSQPKLKSVNEATEYNLYYELNGGVNAASNKDKYEENSIVSLASPTKSGYDFKGWYWDKDFNSKVENSTFSGKAQDLTVYAKWDMSAVFVQAYASNMVTIIPKGNKVELENFAGKTEKQVIYAYSISKYEVTQGLYKAVMGENPSEFEGSENPVENVIEQHRDGVQVTYGIDSGGVKHKMDQSGNQKAGEGPVEGGIPPLRGKVNIGNKT